MNTRLHENHPDPAAFDAIATAYDQLEEALTAFRASRDITHEIFLRYFRPADHLLEVNCGTATDAIYLAGHGMNILATDVSPNMLREASLKIRVAGASSQVEVRLLSFHALETLSGSVFDGAYSNFGGLNCASDLRSIAASLSTLVKPGGYFIATVMPDFCLWETLSMLLHFRWSTAFRRLSPGGTLANVHGTMVPTYYYAPSRFIRSFSDSFSLVGLSGLNIFTPPPGHRRANDLLKPVLPIMNRIDRAVASLPLARRIGDHYIVVLCRNGQ
jgi:ubiquinone/menaquinone biosynthesis C-methylase UbiE